MRPVALMALLLMACVHCGSVVVEASSGSAPAEPDAGGDGGCPSLCEGLCNPIECGTGIGTSDCPPGVPCKKVSKCSSKFCAYCSEDGCDMGDAHATDGACPASATCYEQLLCDATTILCIDDGLPEHGCPEYAPGSGNQCWPFSGMTCLYKDGEGCTNTWFCEKGSLEWTLTKTSCP
jgi:hypothetical protein